MNLNNDKNQNNTIPDVQETHTNKNGQKNPKTNISHTETFV